MLSSPAVANGMVFIGWGSERNHCRQADFSAAFTFAHLAFYAAAIFLRAAADIVLFFGMVVTFDFWLPFFRTFAHRAL